ncbi:MAG: DUF6531 domain-containing protein, partial [Bradymonadaceae bacterium]
MDPQHGGFCVGTPAPENLDLDTIFDLCHPAPQNVPRVCTMSSSGGWCGTWRREGSHTASPLCFGGSGSGLIGDFQASDASFGMGFEACIERPYVPRICESITPVEGGLCYGSPEQEARAHELWTTMLGCTGSEGGAFGYSCCGDGCACMELEGVGSLCTQCNRGGTCRTYYERTPPGGDPRVMAAVHPPEPEPEEDNDGDGNGSDPEVEASEVPPGGTEYLPPAGNAMGQTTPAPGHIEVTYEPEDKPKGRTPDANGGERLDDMTFGYSERLTNAGVEPEENSVGTNRGDPIMLADGSLEIVQADLSFPGAPRPLEFERTYNSRSNHRGVLGSNWTHNFEVRIVPIRAYTAPSWVPAYCRDVREEPRCVFYHDGRGRARIFYFDHHHKVFMPQAGSTDTIVHAGDGWALRRSDGHVQIFNRHGYLTSDRDRFGNGFRVEYEPTPLYQLYSRLCSRVNSTLLGESFNFDGRACDILATIFGDREPPSISPDGITPTREAANGLARAEVILGVDLYDDSLENVELYGKAVSSLGYTAARVYFDSLVRKDFIPQSLTGNIRMRPVRVVDGLGRELSFLYHNDINSLNQGSTSSFGLLREVRGPSGTKLAFNYAQPPDYPTERNELFLVNVTRSDNVNTSATKAAPLRAYEYIYQWPSGASDVSPSSYYLHGTSVRWSYLNYFQTFQGCMMGPAAIDFHFDATPSSICDVNIGMNPDPIYRSGNPCYQAQRQMHEYFSSVADNIIRVERSGITEVETEYVIDPYDERFDHAIMQRYGGIELPGSGYPQFALDYFPGDDASAIPSEIQDRFELEPTFPPATEDCGDPLNVECWDCDSADEVAALVTDGACVNQEDCDRVFSQCDYTTFAFTRAPCRPCKILEREEALPGVWPDVSSYVGLEEFGSADHEGKIWRSPLSCRQIAANQIADPTHNGLVASLSPTATTGDDNVYDVHYETAGRARVDADARRICQWVSTLDRDGSTRYYGLNYRGQALVESIHETEPFMAGGDYFLFTEYLFNADGNLIERREPVRGLATSPGYTRYEYDVILPDENSGWSAYIPGFWTRRNNMTRMETVSTSAPIIHYGSGPTSQALGAVSKYTYEPLFNQLRSVSEGTLWSLGVDEYHRRTLFEFDYQEFTLGAAAGSSPLTDYLLWLSQWGWFWASDANDPTMLDLGWVEGGVKIVEDWQLGMHLYGSDLNGDGIMG